MMTLPSQTEFPCSVRKEDQAIFIWERRDPGACVCIEVPCGDVVCLDREHVRLLRNQLIEWLKLKEQK